MATDASKVRFEIYVDYEGKFRWRLWNDREQVIADSAQSFDSFESVQLAAEEARAKAQFAEIKAPSRGE